MSGNPFKPAEAVVPRVKALVYGQSGVGKTYLALTAPGKVAVIDTEGGTAFYAGRSGLSEFDVLPTKTFNDVTRAIRYLADNPGEYETLVIDPVTVLYETLQDAAQTKRASRRNDPDADLEMLDWQRIKRAYKTLMTDLVNLPMHVIVTARERDETERRGNEQIKVGTRPDAEKSTPYYFDTVLRLTFANGERSAEVLKDRTGAVPDRLAKPSFARLFGKATKANGATSERTVASDEEAAQVDAATTFSDDSAIRPGDDGGLIGRVVVGNGRSDMMLRTPPDMPPVIGFRLVEGSKKLAAEAFGDLAVTIDAMRTVLVGQRITAYGTVRIQEDTKNGVPISWPVLTVTRLRTPDGSIPPDEPEADKPAEAPSVPLFGAEDMAELDAEVARAS